MSKFNWKAGLAILLGGAAVGLGIKEMVSKKEQVTDEGDDDELLEGEYFDSDETGSDAE